MSNLSFDPELVRALAAILQESGLTEIEIADKDSRVRVARAPAMVQAALATPALTAAMASPAVVLPPPTEATDDAHHPGAVLSPMVGIAYLSPEPGAAPFVSPGQNVVSGQTLLLIEAMKTFNQIKAPKAGTVAKILVSSTSPVEYGEVLMILEP